MLPPGFLRRWLFPLLIIISGIAVYHRTIDIPFVFDDGLAVRENTSIRSLAHPGAVLSPPADGSGASGRPLVNLSLALNYALGGLNPSGYHVFNILCHCGAGLLLFAVLRQMFLLPRFQSIFGVGADGVHLQGDAASCGVDRRRGAFQAPAASGCPPAAESCRSFSPERVASTQRCTGADVSEQSTFDSSRRRHNDFASTVGAFWRAISPLPSRASPLLQPKHSAEALAFFAALLWVLHPLQTESVASVIQRTELMVAVFFMATLYGLIRSCSSSRPQAWQAVAVVASMAGMATKEIMVSAPLVVLLYDRALLAGTFAAALKRRRTFYIGLAASWLVLVYLVVKMGGTRGTAAGFGTGVITWWSYFLKQWEAIIQYLRLSAWPHPLVVDYGSDVVTQVSAVAGRGAILIVLGLATAWGLYRNTLWALAGAWFFLILGPSSSVMPLPAQTMAEHRMYLPLAALCAGAIVAAFVVLGRRFWLVAGAVAAGFFAISLARTDDYSSELRLWEDTVAKRPRNERAFHNLAGVMVNLRRINEAWQYYTRALEIEPRYAGPRIGLANCLLRFGRSEEALREYRKVLEIDPKAIEALSNLGVVLCEIGQFDEGYATLKRALTVNPDFADAHFNMGTVLLRRGHVPQADLYYRNAIRLRPDYAEAYNNLGAALLRQERPREAEECFRAALRYKPDYPEAQQNLDTVVRGASR